VLQVAVALRGSEVYASMMDGDNNLFRFALAIAQPNTRPNLILTPSTPVGTSFLVAGRRQWCTHSMMFAGVAQDSAPLFISSLSGDLFAPGVNVDSLVCFKGVSSHFVEAVDLSLFESLGRLYQSAPASLAPLLSTPNACSIHLTDSQIDQFVAGRPADAINIDRFLTGETRDIVILHQEKAKDCGDWFKCGAYGWQTMDLFIKFINVSTTNRAAQIDVRTKMSRNRGLGNETFIQVVSHRTSQYSCDYPTPGSSETHVSFFNMPMRSWFIIGVAWGPPRAQLRTIDLTLSVRYNGPAVGRGFEETTEEA